MRHLDLDKGWQYPETTTETTKNLIIKPSSGDNCPYYEQALRFGDYGNAGFQSIYERIIH